jgi:preprotein translocase subunit SecA
MQDEQQGAEPIPMPQRPQRMVEEHPDPAALAATGTDGIPLGFDHGVGAPSGGVTTLKPVRSRFAAADVDPNDPGTWGKVSRNAACPCGSGKKYKHCHGALA